MSIFNNSFTLVLLLFFLFSPIEAFRTPYSITKSRLRHIEVALALYFDKNNRFPNEEEGLKQLVEKQYIKKEELFDFWKQPFLYYYPSKFTSQKYDLYSIGKNAVDEFTKEDDIFILKSWKLLTRYYSPKTSPLDPFLFSFSILPFLFLFLPILLLLILSRAITKKIQRSKNLSPEAP